MKDTGKTTQIGTLVMASNHIGCTDDIPNRALETLKTADLVLFEEDRPARQTLKAAGIRRDYLKFNEHHQMQTLDEVAEALKKGRTVIYMSDQGSPALPPAPDQGPPAPQQLTQGSRGGCSQIRSQQLSLLSLFALLMLCCGRNRRQSSSSAEENVSMDSA